MSRKSRSGVTGSSATSDAQRDQSVGDRVGEGRGRADRPPLADAPEAAEREEGRRLQVMHLHPRDLARRGHDVVHQRAAEELAVIVVHDLLEMRVDNAWG